MCGEIKLCVCVCVCVSNANGSHAGYGIFSSIRMCVCYFRTTSKKPMQLLYYQTIHRNVPV